MRKTAAIIIFLLIGLTLRAQDQLVSELKQVAEFTRIAWDYAQNTATILQFNNGAADLEEIKYHCYEARMEMDSLYFYTRNAEFKATDAAYAAEDLKRPAAQQQATNIQNYLKAASQSIAESQSKLDLVFDEIRTENIEIQLNQSLEYLYTVRKQLKQAERELKTALKTLY